MKYVLNETPVRTSNNFKINDFSLNLNIAEKELSELIFSFDKGAKINNTIKNNFESKINLKHNKYNSLDIEVFEDSNINIRSELETNYLVDQINLKLDENTNSNIFIKYCGEGFHNLKISIHALDNAYSNITIVNLISKESESFISFESEIKENSNININFIDLGGKIKVSNYYSVLEKNSTNNFNNIYIGKEQDRIDLNYHIINKGEKSNSNIEIAGALFDESNKSFKGVIDFKEGSKKSIGYENENCLLFSDKTISKSLPMLLCHEEDVSGTHSVSSGKVDEEQLFYLNSKGIDEEEAKKLIMIGNFNKVLTNINNKEEIIKYIYEYIK